MARPAARHAAVARARDALAFMPSGDAVVVCSTAVAPILKQELAEVLEQHEGDVRIETRPDLPIGFRVVGAGGALTVDATLERLLELDRPALAIDVLRRLEEASS